MSELVLPQTHVKVIVDFYNEEERVALLKTPSAEQIQKLVNHEIQIPTAEFLTYYLFHRIRTSIGKRFYSDFANQIEHSLFDLTDFMEFNGNSINWPENLEETNKTVTERIAESVGMSVVNRIHGLTRADWNRLPQNKGTGRIFDYEIAADDKTLIKIEAKGSCVKNNQNKEGSIPAHKSEIHAKKTGVNATSGDANTILYGTIAAISSKPDSPLRCWLVDPPTSFPDIKPINFRIVSRMQFLCYWITLVAPKSPLSLALMTRTMDIESIQNPFELDGKILRRVSGEKFSFSKNKDGLSSFFNSKSKIVDGSAGGITIPFTKSPELLFIGFRNELIELAYNQRFENILNYKASATSIERTVNCIVSFDQILGTKAWESLKAYTPLGQNKIRFNARGEISYNQEGLVFGILSA